MSISDFNPSTAQLVALKAALFVLCLVPLGWVVVAGLNDLLGANPVEASIRTLGDWALRLLLLTLAVTPLRRLSGLHWLLRLRRLLGLFAFFYALLHVLLYLWADQGFDWRAVAEDILKRPFITAGFVAFVFLVLLAATSFNAAIRRLGGRRWQMLHRLVYPAAILAVLHFFWMVKLDLREPLLYAAILGILLGLRLWWRWRARGFRPAATSCGKHSF